MLPTEVLGGRRVGIRVAALGRLFEVVGQDVRGRTVTTLPRPLPNPTAPPADRSRYLRVLQHGRVRDVSPLDAAGRLLPVLPQPQRQIQPGEYEGKKSK